MGPIVATFYLTNFLATDRHALTFTQLYNLARAGYTKTNMVNDPNEAVGRGLCGGDAGATADSHGDCIFGMDQFVARTFEEKWVGNKSAESVLILLWIRFKKAASAMAFVQAMGPTLGVLFGKALLRVYETTPT